MHIQSNTPAVKSEIQTLIKLLEENGAWLHDDLSVVEVDGSFSVRMDGPVVLNEPVVKIPHNLFLPMEHMGLQVKGDEFFVEPETDKMSSEQLALLNSVIKIFNLTNKVKLHREECVWIKHREHPALLNALAEARTPDQRIQRMHTYLNGFKNAKDENEFLCWTFLMSRVLDTEWENGEKVSSIMPFIDYFNHDSQGCPYILSNQDGAGKVLQINNWQPYHNLSECFVSYGMYDSLDTLFNYSFPDVNVPFVRSIPVLVDVEGYGTLNINSHIIAKIPKKIPESLKPIRSFLPHVQRKGRAVHLSHICIPVSEKPHALRRILQSVIRTLVGTDASRDVVVENVYKAEKAILSANIAFYTDFLEMVKVHDTPDHLKQPLIDVAQVQLNKLNKYLYKPDFFKAQPSAVSDDGIDVDEADIDVGRGSAYVTSE